MKAISLILKSYFIILIMIGVGLSKAKAQDASAMRKLTGTFLRTEMGDYMHLQIDVDGEIHDLFVFKDDENFRKLETHPDKYEGKKITVFYKRAKANIEEAGGDVEVDQYMGCELEE